MILPRNVGQNLRSWTHITAITQLITKRLLRTSLPLPHSSPSLPLSLSTSLSPFNNIMTDSYLHVSLWLSHQDVIHCTCHVCLLLIDIKGSLNKQYTLILLKCTLPLILHWLHVAYTARHQFKMPYSEKQGAWSIQKNLLVLQVGHWGGGPFQHF